VSETKFHTRYISDRPISYTCLLQRVI